MGRSGSGKSTMMNIIGLIDSYDGGSYMFDGHDIAHYNEHAKATLRGTKIGFIFQSYNLIPRLPIWYQVSLPLFYKWTTTHERQNHAIEMLSRVGLDGMAYKLPNQLSWWQQQRVAIARALVSNPEFMLADEPTGALDSTSSSQIMDIFDSLNAEGKTIIMITHDDDVARRAKQTMYLKDGRVVDML